MGPEGKAKRGWIRGPRGLIEHCNDRASEEGTEQRSVYSQATHFRGGVIRRADKSKQNSLVEIGRGSYQHSEGRREDETERGKNSVQIIFVSHGRKCGFLVVSMVNHAISDAPSKHTLLGIEQYVFFHGQIPMLIIGSQGHRNI